MGLGKRFLAIGRTCRQHDGVAVKATVVDPGIRRRSSGATTSGITRSSPRRCLELLETIIDASFPDHRRGTAGASS